MFFLQQLTMKKCHKKGEDFCLFQFCFMQGSFIWTSMQRDFKWTFFFLFSYVFFPLSPALVWETKLHSRTKEYMLETFLRHIKSDTHIHALSFFSLSLSLSHTLKPTTHTHTVVLFITHTLVHAQTHWGK